MSDVVIQCEGLGKRYRRGERAPYHRASELLTGWAKAPLRMMHKARQSEANPESRDKEGDWFWALKDIDLEVKQGEVLGIIGRNGAGKSTLLKVLSEITEPTAGRAVMRGRVGSLLEVGTGFHPELTGRENIYLNGAVLGMTRPEIKAKFDEIVAFAEVEQFLDTPVKRYSSGMQTRLGFAVAAHLEPEILIVDEVLAVGDAAFQKKCLGKMDDVAKSGRTVLFVSHNLGAVTQLCTTTLLLQAGLATESGETKTLVANYLQGGAEMAREVTWQSGKANYGVTEFAFTHACLHDAAGVVKGGVDIGSGLQLRLRFTVNDALPYAWIGFRIHDATGAVISELFMHDQGFLAGRVEPGAYNAVCRLDQLTLMPGEYTISLIGSVPNIKTLALLEHVLSLSVRDHSGRATIANVPRRGVFMPHHVWEVGAA